MKQLSDNSKKVILPVYSNIPKPRLNRYAAALLLAIFAFVSSLILLIFSKEILTPMATVLIGGIVIGILATGFFSILFINLFLRQYREDLVRWINKNGDN